jgi:hypothetical protein
MMNDAKRWFVRSQVLSSLVLEYFDKCNSNNSCTRPFDWTQSISEPFARRLGLCKQVYKGRGFKPDLIHDQ